MKPARRSTVVGLAAILGLAAATGAHAATYTVTTNADSGDATLRAAITLANANPGKDTIAFNIPGNGAPRDAITPKSSLPMITDPVVIDGYTQPGTTRPTATQPATLAVVINAANSPIGLDVRTDDSLLTGLVVRNANSLVVRAIQIRVEGDGNRVTASHIGTNAAATAAMGSTTGSGIEVYGSENVIGGPPEERVVVSSGYGVLLASGDRNTVSGNRLGTDAAGTSIISASATTGVRIEASNDNVITDNVAVGAADGMYVEGDRNVIRGNRLGTDVTGTVALPNGYGIIVSGGNHNQIGGTAPGEGNIVSGNEWGGIQLASSSRNVIQGNMIGVDAGGNQPLGNGDTLGGGDGIYLHGDHNLVGGAEPGAMNVISDNDGDGIEVGHGASGNQIVGNRIGTDVTGLLDRGNYEHGIHVLGDETQIGDPDHWRGANVISHNGGDGIWVEEGRRNPIRRNVILLNDGLGIDLGPDGHTPEDALDADGGANGRQNAPSLMVAAQTPNGTRVRGILETSPLTEVRVEYFWSSSCDPTGYGEGNLFLGRTPATTDAAGTLDLNFNTTSLPLGSVITATATTVVNGEAHSTSEHSECKVITL